MVRIIQGLAFDGQDYDWAEPVWSKLFDQAAAEHALLELRSSLLLHRVAQGCGLGARRGHARSCVGLASLQ